ncbi:hypothetical protein RIF29_24992 [Crotalaria pallida]|uniref:Uncharacterized protein n=1 Tax=Crotalaria pallida TaxID=3830 RepID=A0AAN9EMZ4_CROPI
MWRQNIFCGNPHSDQSISEEEEEVEAFDDVVSPATSAPALNKVHASYTPKEELPLHVRLDFLKGMRDPNLAGIGSSSSFEKPAGTPLEDEVEMPDFKENEFNNISRQVVANSSDEEVISDDESHKCGRLGASISEFDRLPEIFKAVDPGASAALDGNYLEDEEKIEIDSDTEPTESEARAHGFNLPSMADLFDKLQDTTSLSTKRKTGQLFQKRSISHLQDTIVDSEDSPEPVGSVSSSDNEVYLC